MVHGQAEQGASVALSLSGQVVATYVWGPQLPATVSPRPYLHPVTTLRGTTVTGFMPDDHVHHLGASLAIPVLNRANFWGGRTYVAGRGSVRLDNHGEQRHVQWLHRSDERLVHEVSWLGREGEPLAREERTLAARQVTESTWLLRVGFALRSCTAEPLTIDTPGSRGRDGAGYGGFFWRAPAGLERVRAFGKGSDDDVHGTKQPWVALTGRRPAGDPWTLVFVTGGDDPWFVRATDYAGACPSIAWDRPLVVPADGVLTRSMSVLVADGPPTEEILAQADAAVGEAVLS
jgi:methane monooxygenase PmoA-like